MENDKKKFDGFAVASFVLGLITFIFTLTIIPIFLAYGWNTIISPIVIAYPLILVLSIIFGIASLRKIRKSKNKKGKVFVFVGMISSVVSIILYILMSLLTPKPI